MSASASNITPIEPALSVVMPAYNEEKNIASCLERVLREPFVMEVIVVDDASSDQTAAVVGELMKNEPRIVLHRQKRNQGKGAALRAGFALAGGNVVIVQDADLEYDPSEYAKVLQPIRDGHADVVFGSRFMGGGAHRVLYFWHCVGNKALTLLSNCFTGLNLTDMETGMKVFRSEVVRQLELCENRFGIEPEFAAKVAALRVRIY